MKNLIIPSVLLLFIACSNPGSERTEQKQDVEVATPPTETDTQGNAPDSSANDVQDSSTAVGYDTSSKRAN